VSANRERIDKQLRRILPTVDDDIAQEVLILAEARIKGDQVVILTGRSARLWKQAQAIVDKSLERNRV
jgi:hypothetical protein